MLATDMRKQAEANPSETAYFLYSPERPADPEALPVFPDSAQEPLDLGRRPDGTRIREAPATCRSTSEPETEKATAPSGRLEYYREILSRPETLRFLGCAGVGSAAGLTLYALRRKKTERKPVSYLVNGLLNGVRADMLLGGLGVGGLLSLGAVLGARK